MNKPTRTTSTTDKRNIFFEEATKTTINIIMKGTLPREEATKTTIYTRIYLFKAKIIG